MRKIEENLLVIRQMKPVVDDFRLGNCCKDVKFFWQIVNVRKEVLEWAHDIFYILREKNFIGYEDADFKFSLELPDDLCNFEFRDFEANSFENIVIVLSKLEFTPAKEIHLGVKELESNMELLQDVLVNFSVAIEILKGHFGISDNFDIMKIKI